MKGEVAMSIPRIERTSRFKIFAASITLIAVTSIIAVLQLTFDPMALARASLHVISSSVYFLEPLMYLDGQNDTSTRAVAVVITQGAHNLMYGSVICVTVAWAIVRCSRESQNSERKTSIFLTPISNSYTQILLGTGTRFSQRWVKSPYANNTIALPKFAYDTSHPSGSPAQLSAMLQGLLTHYQDVPAALDGHHGTTTLHEHSISVAKAMRRLGKQRGLTDPLTVPIGLAHDLEKIVGFKKNGMGSWTRVCRDYHIFGPVLLKSLPAFKSLTETDKDCMSRVLAYRHHNGALPYNLPKRHRDLIDLLKAADRECTRHEQHQPGKAERKDTSSDASMALVKKRLLDVLPNLSVNAHSGDNRVEGWFQGANGFFITTVDNIRRHFLHSCSSQEIQSLQLGVEIGKVGPHPFTKLVVETLREAKLLIEEVGGHRAIDGVYQGQIKITASNKRSLHHLILIDRDIFERLHPGVLARWGTMQFQFRAVSPKP